MKLVLAKIKNRWSNSKKLKWILIRLRYEIKRYQNNLFKYQKIVIEKSIHNNIADIKEMLIYQYFRQNENYYYFTNYFYKFLLNISLYVDKKLIYYYFKYLIRI